jgi:hypothetical protein
MTEGQVEQALKLIEEREQVRLYLISLEEAEKGNYGTAHALTSNTGPHPKLPFGGRLRTAILKTLKAHRDALQHDLVKLGVNGVDTTATVADLGVE